MGLSIGELFPKTPPHPHAEIMRRGTVVTAALRRAPTWLVGEQTMGTMGCFYRAGVAVPPEFSRSSYGQPYTTYETEIHKSSEVKLFGLFALPLPETGLTPFQIFGKSKARKELKQVWEYLMLDLWSSVLTSYTHACKIGLTAPVPFQLHNNWLYMAYQNGTIGTHLSADYRPKHLVRDLRSGSTADRLTLYEAFALHLGALAKIKAVEELQHGDFQLRHVLFDAGERLHPYFYLVRMLNTFNHRPTLVNAFLTSPQLSVVDVENAQRTPAPQVQTENEKMLRQATKYATSQGINQGIFERAYRDGYDSISPLNITQTVVDAQYQRWGFSVDTLF